MKRWNKIAIFLLLAGMIFAMSCNRNYYSGKGKGGRNCGCPSEKGMTGF
ncbi:MAG: hypothetical protein JST10_12520 [Bacteroidetes bacterium]|nr:hypothetical protein [Bacteroidota bacterium]MBS1633384.1 hypothetical protein [Bacteroidota bacterium]